MPPVIPDTVALRSKRKASSDSALTSSKFKVRTDEIKIVPNPAKATGLKVPNDESKLEPPPQPILDVEIVDEPKPEPLANIEQPKLDGNLENPVPEVQQQNEGGNDVFVPELNEVPEHEDDEKTESDKGND